jgi:hypothetical protein
MLRGWFGLGMGLHSYTEEIVAGSACVVNGERTGFQPSNGEFRIGKDITMSTNLSTSAVVDLRSQEVRQYLTTAEVGETLRTPVETVRYWRLVGKGPRSFKVGRRVLYAAEDVAAFIAEARSATA